MNRFLLLALLSFSAAAEVKQQSKLLELTTSCLRVFGDDDLSDFDDELVSPVLTVKNEELGHATFTNSTHVISVVFQTHQGLPVINHIKGNRLDGGPGLVMNGRMQMGATGCESFRH